ncbi:MAG: hypothetical protein AB3A66_06165 [Nodularia sp. CChRGM 3473]
MRSQTSNAPKSDAIPKITDLDELQTLHNRQAQQWTHPNNSLIEQVSKLAAQFINM